MDFRMGYNSWKSYNNLNQTPKFYDFTFFGCIKPGLTPLAKLKASRKWPQDLCGIKWILVHNLNRIGWYISTPNYYENTDIDNWNQFDRGWNL